MTTAAASYQDAAFPEPWQVLGLRLRPFSLGHYYKLRRLGCAFVSDTATQAEIGDLLLGIIVCSMSSDPDPTRDEFWQWVGREKPAGWRGWLYRVYCWYEKRRGKEPMTPAEIDVYNLGRRVGYFNLADKVQLFNRYIVEHSTAPAYWDEERAGDKPSGAHWSHSVHAVLTSKLGYSQIEALNAPLSRALNDYFRYAEEQGAVRLMMPHEVERIKAAEVNHGA